MKQSIALLKMLRPKQWVKNGFVFAPLIFSMQFANPAAWKASILAFFAFACVSSTVYIINDIADIESDRNHPRKKKRPIASGAVSIKAATFSGMALLLMAFTLLIPLAQACSLVLITYLALNIAYSKGLKNHAIVDVLIIATGFVLRVLAGGYAINVEVSPWIILSTFLLALFLGFGKRRHELRLEQTDIRESLESYNKDLIDKLINVSCGSALMCYAIYAVETAERIGKLELVYTVVFVAFGLFRYLHFIYFDKKGGSPERILFSDPIFIGNIGLWLATTLWILT